MDDLTDYEHRMLMEAKDQSRLIASIEAKVSIMFWWFVLSVIGFCIVAALILLLGYGTIRLFIESIPF